jgi:hypothetical protein
MSSQKILWLRDYKALRNKTSTDARAGLRECPPKILLLGDSVDWHCVEDVCSDQIVQDWSNNMFGYKQSALGAALCKVSGSGGSIGHLHVFGSNPSGPYLHDLISTLNDPLVDTKARLCKGIEFFSTNVGVPTLIVFQIMLWDVWMVRQLNDIPEEVKVQRYRDNMIARVNEIQECKDQSSVLVLRTVPVMIWGERLVVLFNDVLKNISRDMNIGIIDYDLMLWGLDRNMEREPTLFCDKMHPRKEFSTTFAAHVLDIGKEMCKHGTGERAGFDVSPTLQWEATPINCEISIIKVMILVYLDLFCFPVPNYAPNALFVSWKFSK